jgi:hypothetical protein
MKHIVNSVSVCIMAFAISTIAPAQDMVSKNSKSVQEVIAGIEEADYQLNAIYNLDVFSYFDFGDDSPDTDLKKQVFKKRPEYAEKLAELKRKKAKLASKDYYVKLDELFESNNYDVKRKGFDIVLGENRGQGTMSARAPKSVNNFLLSPLPTNNHSVELFGPGIYEERLFVPMTEENGLEIENNPTKVRVYFLFRISGKQTVHFKYMCLTYGWYDMTQKLLYSDKVRVVVANEETGKIYFDKVYKSK